MTNRGSNVGLQEAFESLAELPAPELSDELRERIWLAVSGELPPAERRALVDRMATDAACAEAWRVAHEMWRACQSADPHRAAGGWPMPQVPPSRLWNQRRWTSPWVAAAATILVAATAGIVLLLDRPPADEFRASPGYAVTSLVPAAAVLPRDQFRLQWTPAPEGSRYQLRATTEDLQLLATAADLAVAEFVVPRAQLAALPDGAIVFWQVDALLPAGERITSPTFVVHVK